MGLWGPKLYQNDIGEDIRTTFKDQLRRGKTGEEITKELIYQYREAISDSDDAPNFWFALADTQWDFGRLDDYVKEKALFYLSSDDCLSESQGIDEWSEERKTVLLELRTKLLSPQPKKKRVLPYKLYSCPWEKGAVFAYKLHSDFAKRSGLFGKYLYFVKVENTVWHPGHIVPTVYFYRIVTTELLNLNEIQAYEYIPQFFVPQAYEKDQNRKKLYLLTLLSKTEKTVPTEQITYIGSLGTVVRVKNEDSSSHPVSWEDFEEYIIHNFQNWMIL